MDAKSHDGEKCNIHVIGMVRTILKTKSLGRKGNMGKIHNHSYGHLYYKKRKKTRKKKGVKRWYGYPPTPPPHPPPVSKKSSMALPPSTLMVKQKTS